MLFLPTDYSMVRADKAATLGALRNSVFKASAPRARSMIRQRASNKTAPLDLTSQINQARLKSDEQTAKVGSQHSNAY